MGHLIWLHDKIYGPYDMEALYSVLGLKLCSRFSDAFLQLFANSMKIINLLLL